MSLLRGAHSGFTLVEVVIALVVFTVGLLGVSGMLTTAARTLNEARATAWSVAIATEVADSLAYLGVSGDGERVLSEGTVRWTVLASRSPASVLIEVEPRRPGSRPYSAPLRIAAVVRFADSTEEGLP